MTLVYRRRGWVAHVLPESSSPNSGDAALCGVTPGFEFWYGTGSQNEIEKAGLILPKCRNCRRVEKDMALKYVDDTAVYKYEETQVTLIEDHGLILRGQGFFEIIPTAMTITWTQMNGESWTMSQTTVRGTRTDTGSTGLRVFYDLDMPTWIKNIVMEVKP